MSPFGAVPFKEDLRTAVLWHIDPNMRHASAFISMLGSWRHIRYLAEKWSREHDNEECQIYTFDLTSTASTVFNAASLIKGLEVDENQLKRPLWKFNDEYLVHGHIPEEAIKSICKIRGKAKAKGELTSEWTS